MKKHFRYAAAAVSAMTVIMSTVPAMAGSLTEVNDDKKDNNTGHQVIVNDEKDNKKEDTKKKDEKKKGTKKEESNKEDEKKKGTKKEESNKEDEKKEETKKEEPKKEDEKKEEAKKEDEKKEETEAPAEETIGYSVLKGKIKEVAVNEDGSARISVETETRGEIVFNEISDCMVIADNAVKALADLKAGMTVSVVMEDNAPMTLSLPPQTSAAVAIVVEGETPSNVAVDKFDEELTGKTVKLIMDEKVQILDIRGTKQALTAEDIKNNKAIVIYGASTKSIPAQTTPYMVIVLPEEEAVPTETAEVAEAAEEVKTLPLREAADSLGYEIKWTSNEEPIVLTKGEKTVSLEINSDTITIDGDMVKDLSTDVVIVDGVTYVPSELVDLLK